MPGTLYVVATPIGNLEDVTLRALRVLREVSVIAAEDTRRTSRLLQHYSISTPTTSLHEHNEAAKTPGLIHRLLAGESIAVVSDAGTPVVSDPGGHIISAAHAAGIRVEPVPGPSAAMAAVSASGVGGDGFVFAGFPPPKAGQRREWLSRLRGEPRPVVLYEAPHRILATLRDMLDVLGDRTVALGRELTKAHEELAVRPISSHLAEEIEARGEFTLVISPQAESPAPKELPSLQEVRIEFGLLTENGRSSRREAIRTIAEKYGIRVKAAYELVEAALK